MYVLFGVLSMKAVCLFLSFFALHGYAERSCFLNHEITRDVQDGVNKFAVNLFKTLLNNERGNFISSPFSVYMALAMVSYGARYETKEELRNVLHLPTPSRNIYPIYTTNSIRAINCKLANSPSGGLRIGNKIFVNLDVSLRPPFEDILEDIFISPSVSVDFTNTLEAAKLINWWSSWFTGGLIKEIVNANDIDSNTKLMLINSVYFLGEWDLPFDVTATDFLPFYVSEDIVKNVPMMFQNGDFRRGLLSRMDAEFVVLPYKNNGKPEDATYMYIILPNKADGLAKVENQIDSITLDDLQTTMEPSNLDLFVPKFKIESTFELNHYLCQLGICSAFTETADFGRMTWPYTKLSIDKIVQKAYIAVDETKTEAAAITRMRITYRSSTPIFIVNQPFLIVLATEDVILFTGKVMDPTN